MDSRYMKSYSTLLIKEMQITNKMRFYLTSFKTRDNCLQGYIEKEKFCELMGCTLAQSLWKTVLGFSKK